MVIITLVTNDNYDFDDNEEEISTINDTITEVFGEGIIVDWESEDTITVCNVSDLFFETAEELIKTNTFLNDLISDVEVDFEEDENDCA